MSNLRHTHTHTHTHTHHTHTHIEAENMPEKMENVVKTNEQCCV